MTMPMRKFGVELELLGTANFGMEAASDAIRAAGVECRVESYSHNVPRTWKIVSDGSLSAHGFEVVSPPLSGPEGIAEVRKVAAALTTALARAGSRIVDRTCGFHVHVDSHGLNGGDIISIVQRYNAFESTIDGFMPESRRASNNQYSRSCTTINNLARLVTAVHQNPRSTAAIRSHMNDREERYYKVNLHAFVRHGTIEFRQHSGTCNGEKIENWIRFCLGFVEASKIQIESTDTTVTSPESTVVVTTSDDGLRINAIERKYLKMAELFDAQSTGSNATYISKETIAEALGCAPTTVSALIAAFRDRFGLPIRNRRGRGYFTHSVGLADYVRERVAQTTNTVTQSAQTRTNTTYRVLPFVDDEWSRGLPNDLVCYYRERLMELEPSTGENQRRR